MKATIDIPEDLYRKIQAKSALAGTSVREVTEMLYRNWLAGTDGPPPGESPEVWLERWLGLADVAHEHAHPGRSARAMLVADRGRLELT